MKIGFVLLAIAIVLLSGVVVFQDLQIRKLEREQAEQQQQTNELAGVVLTFYRSQKQKNEDVEFYRKVDADAWKRTEQLMFYNVSRGKLALPPADAPEILGIK